MSIRRWTLDADDESIHATVRPDGDWMKASEVLEALAAKEREIAALKSQVEKYRNSHVECIFRHVSNSFAEDRFKTYDERCALCKEHDALLAARAAEKGRTASAPICGAAKSHNGGDSIVVCEKTKGHKDLHRDGDVVWAQDSATEGERAAGQRAAEGAKQ